MLTAAAATAWPHSLAQVRSGRGRVKLRNRSTIMILASERGSKIEAA